MDKITSISICVSRVCFVKCTGCYNFFGKNEKIIETNHIVKFLKHIRSLGFKKTTICGGDPLARHDIVNLLSKIKKLGFFVSLDTVGTPLIGNAAILSRGSGFIRKIHVKKIAKLVDIVGIPIDGSSNDIIFKFREGRKELLEEQLKIINFLWKNNIKTCINTVVHKSNIEDAYAIAKLISKHPFIYKWQIFQYMPIGPMGCHNKKKFDIGNEEFAKFCKKVFEVLYDHKLENILEFKCRNSRKNSYLLVDTDGFVWKPKVTNYNEWSDLDNTNSRTIIGNIKNITDITESLRM